MKLWNPLQIDRTVKSTSNWQIIKKFSNNLPGGIIFRELKRWIRNGNAILFSSPDTTLKQLLHDLEVNLDYITDTVFLKIGINDILIDTSTSNIESLIAYIKEMVQTMMT